MNSKQSWEDELERIEYQNWLQNLPKKYDERSAQHNGLIGPGAALRSLIKEQNKLTPLHAHRDPKA